MASDVVLRLENVSKDFPGAEGGVPIHVLREVTLDILRGEAVAIVGPSGSGKSTLLQLLGSLDAPTSGRLWLEGQDLNALDEAALAEVRNRKIGFVFQSAHLLPHCTVWENVLVPTLPGGASATKAAEERARRLLQRVGLGERTHHRPGQLSGGERQRVAVVRALINQPPLLLADEPTGALDRASAEGLAQLLVELNREEGVMLIVVTHALDLAKRMGRVLELRDGKLEPQSVASRA
jgi:lipoprotein-releasing system ATP-binding protein